ncbi:hypothetical protein EYC84_003257 [Monilinia fructicola]|uniref:Uncharacterized protein n=1 Tax=Monilinia fructicola TaxID=38448 RepID=A0A5M9JW26_MONFR|nr:hypothetical protein EYC84_003257 [Monilinia fructicola]
MHVDLPLYYRRYHPLNIIIIIIIIINPPWGYFNHLLRPLLLTGIGRRRSLRIFHLPPISCFLVVLPSPLTLDHSHVEMPIHRSTRSKTSARAPQGVYLKSLLRLMIYSPRPPLPLPPPPRLYNVYIA